LRRGLSHVAEALDKKLRISIPELDVVTRCRTCLETGAMADYKGSGLGFGFADSTRRAAPTIAAMQKFVRQFVRQG
jgi:hypothetical protein